MILLAAQPDVNNIIPLATLIVMILGLLIGGYWAIVKGGVKSKDESHDKDLLLLKKDMQAEINKERGSREKFQIQVNNKQADFNKDFMALVNKIDNNQQSGIDKWDEFTRYQQQWADGLSERHQDTSRELIATNGKLNEINGKLNEIDSKIETESQNIKTMAEKSIVELNEAKETYRKASEKTTQ